MDEAAPPGDLTRTMRFDPMTGFVDLENQLEQLRDAAEAGGHHYDRHAVRNDLQAATFRLRQERCVRLLMSPSGAVAIEVYPEP